MKGDVLTTFYVINDYGNYCTYKLIQMKKDKHFFFFTTKLISCVFQLVDMTTKKNYLYIIIDANKSEVNSDFIRIYVLIIIYRYK